MTIKLPVDIGSKLRTIAKDNCRSMASQIAYMIKSYMTEESFEEYYQRNREEIDADYDDAKEGRNCKAFDSWEAALQELKK